MSERLSVMCELILVTIAGFLSTTRLPDMQRWVQGPPVFIYLNTTCPELLLGHRGSFDTSSHKIRQMRKTDIVLNDAEFSRTPTRSVKCLKASAGRPTHRLTPRCVS